MKQGNLVVTGTIVAFVFTGIPEWTTWFLLVAMALYDVVAVLTPNGPLKVWPVHPWHCLVLCYLPGLRPCESFFADCSCWWSWRLSVTPTFRLWSMRLVQQ